MYSARVWCLAIVSSLEECLIQETGEEEYVNNLKEKVFELDNSIAKLNVDHENVIGEKEKQSKQESLKVYGINSAGLMNKLDSFENVLQEVKPSIFCIQETKLKRPNQIKTKSSQSFTIYELNRKSKGGGGLCVGVHKDLQPVWVAQGDDDLECLAVEVWVEDFPIRVVVAYGPQLGDGCDKKQHFWEFIEQQAVIAQNIGAGFILQMDSNAHLGTDVINGDVNEQNVNGKYFVQFLERMPSLTLINSLQLCEGKITRMRKTTRGVEQSILDVYVTCDKILPYITKMKVDENR